MYKSDEVVLHFTRRAEELRAIASNLKDPEAKDAMLRWADDYDRLAERAMQLGTFGMPRESAPSCKSSDVIARR